MATSPSRRRRLAVTALALTGTTEIVARWTGAAAFLPRLFALRYANMGGLAAERFTSQLAGARSFRDDRWCRYWDRIAADHLAGADRLLSRLVVDSAKPAPSVAAVVETEADGEVRGAPQAVGALIAPAAALIADHGPQRGAEAIERLVRLPGYDAARDAFGGDLSRLGLAVSVIDQWIKAITYYQVSAFPGHTPARTEAYWRSRRLFDALVTALAPGLDVSIEHVGIPVEGDVVNGYLIVPPTAGPHPVVLMSNGLEGTVQELAIPMLRHRNSGLATFLMEMPGSYAHRQPMSGESESIYRAVIDHLAREPRVDPERIAMAGVSFGAYWSTRLAATEPRLRCVMSCGAPLHRAFQPSGSLGQPQVILEALRHVTGSPDMRATGRALHSLSLGSLYERIRIPVLVINGDNDTLIGTQDSIDLATHAPNAMLKLYPNDDHCAMGHYDQWIELTQRWLCEHLDTPQHAPTADSATNR